MNRRDLLKSLGGVAAAVCAGLGLSKVVRPSRKAAAKVVRPKLDHIQSENSYFVRSPSAGPLKAYVLDEDGFLCGQSGILINPEQELRAVNPQLYEPDYAKGATNIADGPVVPLEPEPLTRTALYPGETARLNLKPSGFGSEQASVIVHDHTGKVVDRYEMVDGIRIRPGERNRRRT